MVGHCALCARRRRRSSNKSSRGNSREQIIEGFNPIKVSNTYIAAEDKFKYNVELNVSNPKLSKPMIHEKDGSTKLMTPNDARVRNFKGSRWRPVQQQQQQ
uniref:Uncharacterized protein n=1 Tax=Dunaliella tertiolecta TaxID=3047 RepID=A0A7S3QTK4_DUNTE